MKNKYLYALLATTAAFNSAQAATIFEIQADVAVYADSVIDKTGIYHDQSFTGFASSTPATLSQLNTNLSGDDLTTYAWTPNAHLPSTKVPGQQPVGNSYIDLSFSGNIYNRDGVDLVLFFAGNGTILSTGTFEYNLSVDIGADDSIEASNIGVITSSTSSIYSDNFFASYALIDLDDFGFDQYTALGEIRIHLGDVSMPALAAVGAYHTTAVPLPTSLVLFGSGLSLLSLFRKKAHT